MSPCVPSGCPARGQCEVYNHTKTGLLLDLMFIAPEVTKRQHSLSLSFLFWYEAVELLFSQLQENWHPEEEHG